MPALATKKAGKVENLKVMILRAPSEKSSAQCGKLQDVFDPICLSYNIINSYTYYMHIYLKVGCLKKSRAI